MGEIKGLGLGFFELEEREEERGEENVERAIKQTTRGLNLALKQRMRASGISASEEQIAQALTVVLEQTEIC
ncbi:hypothetical protein CsSME_00008339 [Camellia sinensis var. sinensis]